MTSPYRPKVYDAYQEAIFGLRELRCSMPAGSLFTKHEVAGPLLGSRPLMKKAIPLLHELVSALAANDGDLSLLL